LPLSSSVRYHAVCRQTIEGGKIRCAVFWHIGAHSSSGMYTQAVIGVYVQLKVDGRNEPDYGLGWNCGLLGGTAPGCCNMCPI
jgi:hypothetical protein